MAAAWQWIAGSSAAGRTLVAVAVARFRAWSFGHAGNVQARAVRAQRVFAPAKFAEKDGWRAAAAILSLPGMTSSWTAIIVTRFASGMTARKKPPRQIVQIERGGW